MGLFDKYEETLKVVDEDLREAFIAYSLATIENPNQKDGPIGFIILSLMQQNINIKEELNQLRKSHTSLMSIYANNN